MKQHDTSSFRSIQRSITVFTTLLCGALGVHAQISAYTFDQGFATYSSISGTGTSIISGSWDNNVSAAVPLNFTFNFNGTNYTDCYINSNGYLTFGSASTASSTTPISSSSGYAGAVSAYGQDLIRSSASDPIRYQTLGSSPNRVFVAEWRNVRRRYAGLFGTSTASDAINFQIRLYETSNTMEVRFGSCSQGSTGFATVTCQVGLRGSANSQFNNRTSTSDWSATTAGTSNTASVQNGSLLGQIAPAANLTLRWTPPTVCTIPTATAVAVTSSSVSVSWTCSGCSGPFVLEYGPETLLPGAGATAGQGGTIVSTTATSPTVVPGLSANTKYKFAVRQLCTSPIYTANSSVVTSTPFDCSSATTINCATATSFTLNGSGNSAYATSAAPCNFSVPGQESLYQFTTTYPGVNRLNVTSHSGSDFLGGALSYVDYQVAPQASGCAQAAYTCIDDINATGSVDFTLPAGTYYLLVDAEQTGSVSETFNIQCAAPPACVAAPTAPANGASGLCQPVTLSWPAVTAFPSATGYDVYLDAGSGAPTTLVSSNQVGTTYNTGVVAAGTYSWRVVPRNASGAATGCTFWTFSVSAEPNGDRAVNAITVSSLPASLSGNNRATNCFNNDFTTTSTPGNANAQAGRDVFYKVTTSSCTQSLSAGVCASAGGNSYIHLITQFGVSLANNDNTEPAGCANTNSSSFSNVAVSPNTTYYIVVESTTAGNEFDFTLTISETLASADSDGDGTADCADGCPGDPNKVDPGVCGCGFTDVDTDLDGVEDCFDGCPLDPAKFDPGVCGCGVADVPVTWYADSEGDGFGDPLSSQEGYTCDQPSGYVLDATDDCPTVNGRQGDACNDGNPFTTGDAIDASCQCIGTPVPAHDWTMRTVTDGAGGEITWEIRDVSTNFLLASGGPFPNNSTIDQLVSIPDVGNFTLRVLDAGNNGIGNGGGYLLRDHNGRHVIDNLGNGHQFTSVSESPLGFFTPVGTDRLRDIDCNNVERWPFEMIVATPNHAVSAQWQVGSQTDDGYEFWFTDPNGSYSRRVFRSHATSGGYGPANAQRACKLGLASFTVNPLPQNTLLNVRVRGRVNGVDQPWGPACRLKVDPAAANCHSTQLEHIDPVSFSCGVTGLKTNGSSRIWARPVTRYIQASNTYVNANRYWFHFVNVGENTSFDITLNSYPMLIYPQYAFQLGATYDVTVRASLDGGASYCPVGNTCQISFAATNTSMEAVEEAVMSGDLLLWPNPNRGDELRLSMADLTSSTGTVTVDVVNMFGERVLGRTLNVGSTGLNTSLKFDQELASGLYLVNLTVDGKTITKRLVVQR